MKKIEFLIFMLIMLLTISVKADSTVTMNLVNCSETSIRENGKLECDITIQYDEDELTVNKLVFTYDTKLNLVFKNGTNTAVTTNKNKIQIASPRLTITPGDTIGKMIITVPSDLASGSYPINFSDIQASNAREADAVYTVSNLTKNMNVINLNLKELKIDGKVISGFSSEKLEYAYTTGNGDISIDAKGVSDNVKISGLGGVRVGQTGTTVHEVFVELDGSNAQKIYKINITYKPEVMKSNDNTLKSLELYNGEEKLDFAFDTKKTSFNYNVLTDVEKLTIKATVNNEKASFVNKYGPRDINLNYGKNKVEIRVKAENGTTKTYTLNITREDGRSDDATLSELSVDKVKVLLTKDNFEYKVDVKYNVKSSMIIARPSNSKASVEFMDIDLVDGENQPIVIKVTSEKGTTKEYKVIINRLSEEVSKVVLETIEIKGHDISFEKDKTTYDLNLAEEEETLDIVVKPDTITKEFLGNKDLRNNSVVIVRVVDDDGEKRYTLNIHKPEKSSLEWLCYTIFGLGFLTFLLSIIYSIKKKKQY